MSRSVSSLVGTGDLPILYAFPPRPLHPRNNPEIKRLPNTAGPSHRTMHHGYGRARRTLMGVILFSLENRKTLMALGLLLPCRGPLLAAVAYRLFTHLYQSDGADLSGGGQ